MSVGPKLDNSTTPTRDPQPESTPESAEALCKMLAERLDGITTSRGWKCRCPCLDHDDEHPSLSLSINSTSKQDIILLHCHAGCSLDSILTALDLTKRDLKFSKYDVPDSKNPPRKPVALYNYHDANGNVTFRSVRTQPKGFYQQRPDGQGGWINNMDGVQRVLYHLSEVIDANQNEQTIHQVEGEKDADNLRNIGLIATTNVGGAGKWESSYTDTLRNAVVVIMPDNDPTGLKHAYRVANELFGVAKSVKVLKLPDLPEKGDVSDWLAAGGTREQLEILIEDTPLWDPNMAAGIHDELQEWEPPISFDEPVLPPFPVDRLPEPARSFVEALAMATQTPVDLAGMLALTSIATAVAGKVAVHVRPGYNEPVNIYVAVVLPPGSRKSAVFAETTAPIRLHEEAEIKRLEPEIAAAETLWRITEQSLRQAESKAAKATDKTERDTLIKEAEELARQLAEMQIPARPRFITEDVTAERLSTLIMEQGGRMAVMSAEGGDVFEQMAGRYSSSRAANFGVYLKGHAGDPLRVDRVGRKAELVHNPALTLALTVQPDVIHGLADKPRFRGRGLLGRFLYSLPPNPLGHRKPNAPPVPEQIRDDYYEMVKKLLKVPFKADDEDRS